MPKVIVKIDRDGRLVLETQNFQGPVCLTDVEKILKKLKESGIDYKQEELQYTEEFYEKEEAQRAAA